MKEVPLRCSGLRIQCCHCCGMGSILGPGTSTCCGCDPPAPQKKEAMKETSWYTGHHNTSQVSRKFSFLTASYHTTVALFWLLPCFMEASKVTQLLMHICLLPVPTSWTILFQVTELSIWSIFHLGKYNCLSLYFFQGKIFFFFCYLFIEALLIHNTIFVSSVQQSDSYIFIIYFL